MGALKYIQIAGEIQQKNPAEILKEENLCLFAEHSFHVTSVREEDAHMLENPQEKSTSRYI